MSGDAMRDVLWNCIVDADVELPRKVSTMDFADAILAAITAAPASARLALARAITPPDHAVVPVEATDAMLSEGEDANIGDRYAGRYAARAVYRVMIAAARGADADEGGK